MKNYQRLKGLIAASFTPMDAHGKVNLSAIDKYADLMAEQQENPCHSQQKNAKIFWNNGLNQRTTVSK